MRIALRVTVLFLLVGGLGVATAQTADGRRLSAQFERVKVGYQHSKEYSGPNHLRWQVDVADLQLPAGEHEVTTSVANLQGTYVLRQAFHFNMVDGVPLVDAAGGPPATPSLSLSLLVLAAFVGVIAQRRPGST